MGVVKSDISKNCDLLVKGILYDNMLPCFCQNVKTTNCNGTL